MNIELRDYLAAQAMNAQIISVEGIERTNSEQCGALASCAYAMADAMLAAREAGKPKEDGEGWIKWYGGECPVDETAYIEAVLRNEMVTADVAGAYRWDHTGYLGDVVAYRVPK